jgi:hypothetical protein
MHTTPRRTPATIRWTHSPRRRVAIRWLTAG